jgi:hypothetical protein
VETITFDCRKDGKTGKAIINRLQFDWDSYMSGNDMNPGSAAIAEFDELEVKKITITIKAPSGRTQVSVPEIVVLGK